jgi:acetyl esterase/lipase
MGSSYFYLEFLLVWHTLLKTSGFRNPAIFALEYTLVPDACYPTQLQQTMAGYKHVLSIISDSSKVCVSGDSAGALLILSLLLHLAHTSDSEMEMNSIRPGMAILISPWVTLVSIKYKNTPGDYLDVDTLHLYAHQYAGKKVAVNDALVSPGNCKDLELWRQASPSNGFGFLFGSEEVFALEIRDLITLLRKTGANVETREEEGGIHAWPVATLFLSGAHEGRQKGLKTIVHMISERMTKATA